jgi:hypothetical protein
VPFIFRLQTGEMSRRYLVWTAGDGGLMAAVLGPPSIQAPKPVSANKIIFSRRTS